MRFDPQKHAALLRMAAIVSAVIGLLFLMLLELPLIYFAETLLPLALLPPPVALMVALILFLALTKNSRRRQAIVSEPIPASWDAVLGSEVAYYSTLKAEEKGDFKRQLQLFLGEKTITGIEVEVDEKCRLLVAASAVIPVFNYKNWEYHELSEILIYPENFNENFEYNTKDNNILGMVINNGTTMILSRSSLYDSFRNDKDSFNVGFHEFAHKIDGEDGYIDGLPAMMLDSSLHKRWIQVVEMESELIEAGKSDINPYALTNGAEFFAVVTEYFFENPSTMEREHKELYELLKTIYRQDTKSRFNSMLNSLFRPYGKRKLGRNSPCPCGSGLKFKKCCLNKVKK